MDESISIFLTLRNYHFDPEISLIDQLQILMLKVLLLNHYM